MLQGAKTECQHFHDKLGQMEQARLGEAKKYFEMLQRQAAEREQAEKELTRPTEEGNPGNPTPTKKPRTDSGSSNMQLSP